MQTSQTKPFREVTKTVYSKVTYCITEASRSHPEDRSQDNHIYAIVSLKGNEVTDIKMAEFDMTRGIPAQALWALQMLLPQLIAEGYVLAYKPVEPKENT